MTFTSMCVGAVIIIAILIITGLIGAFSEWLDYNDEFTFLAWIICAIGFGVCLTILLYQNGIIK